MLSCRLVEQDSSGATTVSITTFGIMTLSINGLFLTLYILDSLHNKTVIMLSVAANPVGPVGSKLRMDHLTTYSTSTDI